MSQTSPNQILLIKDTKGGQVMVLGVLWEPLCLLQQHQAGARSDQFSSVLPWVWLNFARGVEDLSSALHLSHRSPVYIRLPSLSFISSFPKESSWHLVFLTHSLPHVGSDTLPGLASKPDLCSRLRFSR